MHKKKQQALEAIAKELKTIAVELQQIRMEMHLQSALHKADQAPIVTGPRRMAESPGEIDEVAFSAAEGQDGNGAVPAAAATQVETGENALAVYDWLTKKGITVKNFREENVADAVFDQLASFLGDRFHNVSRVHEYIRRNISTGTSFTMNMSAKSQDEIADSTQFCSMLSSYAFLSSYKYSKNTKTLYAVPQRVGNVINFFTGGWFERYIYLRIHALLTQNNVQFTCLLNPQITFANGDDFELDLILIIENQPLWVECKTGDYQGYIAKYSDTKKILGVPKPRAILVILDIPSDLTESLTHLYDITVANQDTFLFRICDALDIPGDAQEQEISYTPAIASGIPGSLQTILNKAGLRPVPEYRHSIINALINTVGSADSPMTMTEVKAIIAEQIDTSKSQLQDVLNAVIRSGCLLDDNGLEVLAYTSPFSSLISYSPSVIESKCIESYVHAVWLVDPSYFDNLCNTKEFEQVVGGKVPAAATLKLLGELPPAA